MTTWTLQDARARFGDMLAAAARGLPQRVALDEGAVVVVSADVYEKLLGAGDSLVTFFARSPHRDVVLDVERSNEVARVIDL